MPIDNDLTESLLFSMNKTASTLPPDPEGMNHARAEAAFRALRSFSQDFGENIDDFEGEEQLDIVRQNAIDLVADLSHLFDRLDFHLVDLLESAGTHYAAETEDEGRQFNFL